MAAVSSFELLDTPRLRRLWTAVHRRLEETSGRVEGVYIHLRGLGDDERAAIDRLLGIRTRAETVRLELDRLDRLMAERLGLRLLAVVASIVGPVRDRPGERASTVAEQDEMWSSMLSHGAVSRHPGLEAWLDGLRRRGTWRRAESPERDLSEALEVLCQLPQGIRCGRGKLSVRVLGDAHGLDDGTPVGRLVLAALASLDGTALPLRAADRRRLWAEQGVFSDDTSSTVLTLGLQPLAAGPLTEAAARWGGTEVPLTLTLAAVQAEAWRVPAGSEVWVCENPSVLAAGSGTGATIVCVEGRPSVAANLLLSSLADGGARLRYHGDFGAGGISIANAIMGGFRALPWRFQTPDHALALERARASGTRLRALRGKVPDATWDVGLSESIRASGVEVEEEFVIDLLVSDLAGG